MKIHFRFTRVLAIVAILILIGGYSNTNASSAKVKKKLINLTNQSQNTSGKTKKFIIAKLIPQITNSVIVSAVKAQNSKRVTLAEIKKIDQEWKDAEEELEIHNQMLTGKCADEVRNLVGKLVAVGETFVTDNQGANVCQNELTGDYWQGDEAKWKNSFNGGKGGIDIGVEKLDRSSNMVLQQVSLPVVDKDGKVIGAITYGVMTHRL